MSEDTVRDKAKASVEAVLEGGQSVQQGDLQVSKASLAAAHDIQVQEESREAQRSGRRPLFRNFNLSEMK